MLASLVACAMASPARDNWRKTKSAPTGAADVERTATMRAQSIALTRRTHPTRDAMLIPVMQRACCAVGSLDRFWFAISCTAISAETGYQGTKMQAGDMRV